MERMLVEQQGQVDLGLITESAHWISLLIVFLPSVLFRSRPLFLHMFFFLRNLIHSFFNFYWIQTNYPFWSSVLLHNTNTHTDTNTHTHWHKHTHSHRRTYTHPDKHTYSLTLTQSYINMQARAKDESLTHASESLRAAQDTARRAGMSALLLTEFDMS